MIEPLALKYRPKKFSEVIGQQLTAVVLEKMVEKNEVPPTLLFRGPRGTGKTSVARILAMELLPAERDAILSGNSLAVIEIDAASNGRVDDVRSLIASLRHSVGTEYRVVILDEAHSITREGFNALLKTLEEPPSGVVFVLVTTEPEKLPDTILSRVMEFEFRRVKPSDILARIRTIAELESIEVQNELAEKIAENANGSVRDAVMTLDLTHRAEIDDVEKYTELTGEKDVGPLLLAALMTNNHETIFKVVDKLMLETGDPRTLTTALMSVIRDLFVLKSGGRITAAGKAYDYRVRLSQLVSSNALYAGTLILWELKTKVRASENPLSSLEQALILVAEKISEGKVYGTTKSGIQREEAPVDVASEPAARPLSLSEIQMS